MTHVEPAPSRVGKIVLYVLAAAALLLIALVVFLLLFIRTDAFETVVRDRVLPKVSERIGRQVTVQSIDARVLPRPQVLLQGLQVASRGGPPILRSETVAARLRLWPLITSRGQHLILDSLHFVDTEVHLIRRPGGQWDLPRPAPRERKIEVDLERVTLQRGNVHVLPAPDAASAFDLANLQATASFLQGKLAFRELTADVYGGSLRGGGSSIDLSRPTLPWVLDVGLQGLDLGALPLRGEPLAGRVSFGAKAAARGVLPSQIGETANGTGDLRTHELSWRSLDLDMALQREVSGWLRKVGVPAAALEEAQKATGLGDLRANVLIQDGWMRLAEPIAFPTRVGQTTVGGRIRTDLQLDLSATTQVDPARIASWTQGELRPDAPVPLTYAIRGTFTHPTIASVDPTALLPLLGEEAGKRLQEGIREGLRKVLPPLGSGATPAPPSAPP